MTRPARDAHRRSRRASAYVLVLVTTAIVTAVALMGATVWRTRLVAADLERDRSRARLHARAALDLGLLITQTEDAWRAGRGDEWFADKPLSGGLLSLYASDPGDADLDNNDLDPVRLRAVGRSGVAREVVEAMLEAVRQPFSSLVWRNTATLMPSARRTVSRM